MHLFPAVGYFVATIFWFPAVLFLGPPGQAAVIGILVIMLFVFPFLKIPDMEMAMLGCVPAVLAGWVISLFGTANFYGISMQVLLAL